MACTALTKGRGLDCNRISGGIKFIYFAVYDQVTSIPTANGEITDLEMGSNSLYRYTMPLGVASLTDTITGSRENGTIFYTPTVNIILNRLTKKATKKKFRLVKLLTLVASCFLSKCRKKCFLALYYNL